LRLGDPFNTKKSTCPKYGTLFASYLSAGHTTTWYTTSYLLLPLAGPPGPHLFFGDNHRQKKASAIPPARKAQIAEVVQQGLA
jgi:hypothetical protein